MIRLAVISLALAAALPSVAFSHGAHEGTHSGHGVQHAKHGAKAQVPLYDNLGNHSYRVTTRSAPAQRYFDQGLRLYYAFNHQESIRAFEEAARLDPSFAMAHWGIALALGPNINALMDAQAGKAAYAAIQKAMQLSANGSAQERSLIRALAARYAAEPPEERSALDRAYAAAMQDVVRRYPKNLEVRTLYAEALMDLSPWDYWTREGKPRENTHEVIAQLEHVLAANPNHPGANHFYIHAVEAAHPERAVASAERLAKLMPGAGHIVHMPGHIYIRVGRYLDAIKANEHAIHADESYIRDQSPAFGAYVAGYYPHNYDFLAFAASMIARKEQAIGAAEKIAHLASPEVLRAPGMAFTQNHHTRHLQMKVRFGQWADILNTPAPAADLLHARAMWHYARGRALAAQGDVAAAQEQLKLLRAAAQNPQLAQLRLEFNTSGHVVGIAADVLAGHIDAARGDLHAAIVHLWKAARAEDDLVYGEPPEWSVPVRQELGLVLLKAGRIGEAERAFGEDLKRFPENVWSLDGMAQALRAQNRIGEAEAIIRRLKRVWSMAHATPAS